MAENTEKNRGLARDFRIDRAKLDESKRTIELAFSSESPVERWGENEVLSHEKGDYDFSRLNDSHPLLLGHDEWDPTCQIGVIESAQVDGDKVGRAVVRFGNGALATEIYNDVKDGIRKLVSVGYDRTSIVSSKKAPDNRVTTRYRWMPTHIAIVPVPADTKAGVGRDKVDSTKTADAEDILKNLTDEQKANMKRILLDAAPANSPASGPAPDETAIRVKVTGEVGTQYKARAKEIRAIEQSFIKDHGAKDDGAMADKIRGLAHDYLAGEHCDAPLAEFKNRCLEDILKAKPAKTQSLEDVADEDGQRRYSIQRAIRSAYLNREKNGTGIPDGLEGEVHQEIIRRARSENPEVGLGYSPKGFLVPHDATITAARMSVRERRILRERLMRDSQATIFGAGGAFVATDMVLPPIELLRNQLILERSGYCRVMSGLTGLIVFPRQEAAATAYSVSEIGALTASQQILGQIAMSPKRVGSTQNYSKQLVMQSSPDIESFIRDDHFKVLALQIDRLGLNGSGAGSEPLGIMNTPGVQSIIFGATPTYAKMVDMETALLVANITDPLTYISTPATRGALKKVAEALTGATTVGGASNAIWKGDNTVNGCPALHSNQVPGNQVILGAEGQALQGIWGGLDIVVDIYTKAVNAEIAVTFNVWTDFAVRHPQAFIVSADAGNQ